MNHQIIVDAEMIFVRLKAERAAELTKVAGRERVAMRDVLMIVTYDEGNWRPARVAPPVHTMGTLHAPTPVRARPCALRV